MTPPAQSGLTRERPPILKISVIDWLRANLFNSIHNTILTVLCLLALFFIVPDAMRWTFFESVWYTEDSNVCRAAAGACWAVIPEKYRLILFGTFPYDEHWRGLIVILIIVGLTIISAFERFWSIHLFTAWIIAFAIVLWLMLGGSFGLKTISTNRWGGLPLTLILFVGTVVGGLPMAIFLALGRRSELPVVKAVCVATIEIIRGVPLITVLFMFSLMFPLFMPAEITVDKILRAQVGMIIFFAAYGAEVIRGGLQAIPRGQYEAADSLGLSYWKKTRKIIMPQALRIVIPPLVNDIIRAFKNTTFVSILGLFDLLGATKAATEDPKWQNYAMEAYAFIFLIYFIFCFSMSKYSEGVERKLSEGRNY